MTDRSLLVHVDLEFRRPSAHHGFVYEPGGWRLAPAYDLNPVPVDIKPRVLTTRIDEADGTASLDLAYQVAPHFGVKPERARGIAAEVGAAVNNWRAVAKPIGLSAAELERMESAFEHAELRKATGGKRRLV
jgi:serine/threonine-protein kinase HipA